MSTKMEAAVTRETLNRAMSYNEYMQLLEDLLAVNKTTGENQSEAMVGYGKMNVQRMKRLNKKTELQAELLEVVKNVKRQMTFLVITEGWCGDAAQNVPVINKLAEQSDFIDLKLILRDENLEIMDDFLTNGGRSIPKLIALDTETLDVIDIWGPRPQTAQHMVSEFKKNKNGDYSEFVKDVQLWYAKDKTISMQNELIALLKAWS